MPFYSPRTCPQRGQTSITHASRGFDFLGFNIRRYPNGKLLIKPRTAAIKRIRKRLREVFQTMLGASARELIQTLNPIISGWAAYYRTAVSSGAFSLLDDYVWKLALKWATCRHRNKPKRWIADRYFGRFHPHRKDRWVLGDRDSGVYCDRVPMINRVVAYADGDNLGASRDFYVEVLGFSVAMEDPVLGLTSPTNPSAQVLIPPRGMESPQPRFGVDVGDPEAVDVAHSEAVRRGLRVVYPLSNEPWGVRRFFVEDPSGTVINVLAHLR